MAETVHLDDVELGGVYKIRDRSREGVVKGKVLTMNDGLIDVKIIDGWMSVAGGGQARNAGQQIRLDSASCDFVRE